MEIPEEVATACIQLLLKNRNRLTLSLADQVAAGLLRENAGAKEFLAQKLDESATLVFEEFYELGDGSASALANVVLDESVWPDEYTREINERDVFQLFLAKLMEVGHDHDGKALKGIARLLAADVDGLHPLVDEELFDAILSSLDNRLPREVQSQAAMATAKFLLHSEGNGERYLQNFIRKRMASQKNEDLILAFSAAAAVFPLVPPIASSLFLTEGFVPSLAPLVQNKAKSDRVEQAALIMLSAACLDSACRQTIRKHCMPWLESVIHNGKEKIADDAVVILAKLQRRDAHAAHGETVESSIPDITERLKQMVGSPNLESQDSSIEGLAFDSCEPKVKDQLIKDSGFLETLVQRLMESPHNSMATYGVLTILDNLARYLPQVSEEQKKMSELKAYANAYNKPPTATSQFAPLVSEPAVTARCTVLINSTSLLPVLSRSHKNFSASSTRLMISILFSLTRNPRARGKLAQRGVARLLLHAYTSIVGTLPEDDLTRYKASHGLARLMITVDPALIFPRSGSPPLVSTVRPLIILLGPPPEDPSATIDKFAPRDLLPTFEALLALTNVASKPDPDVAEQITRLANRDFEDLLFSKNAMVSRAATELCCNLVLSDPGLALFASPTPEAKRRVHVLLVMADDEDPPTRRAAGGALAGIVVSEGGVQNVMVRPGGVDRLVCLAEDDEDEGCRIRGLTALGRVAGLEAGQQMILAVKGGGIERVEVVAERAEEEREWEVQNLAEQVLVRLRIKSVDRVD